MTLFRRALVGLILTLLTLVPGALVAAKAEAAPKAVVGGGTAIVLGGKAACTMTAVGRDRTGQLVGLTAGHCGKPGDLVYAERQRSAGNIGRVALTSSKYDAAVIALDANRVRPVRTVGGATIRGVGRMPGFGANVCKQGRTTGFTCGPVLDANGLQSSSYVCGNSGDSGAPVLQGNRVVGMLNGRQYVLGVAIHCVNPAFPVFTPMVATNMTDIVASLNRYGKIGAGFRPI
ncbi:S1 family peptidase [Gordonia sp. PP30]|uniref:S1 family peptidase n=1 Tax=Gordonia sp. PP30 TaxID=2935861 RepID=UPI001FFE43B2|nr:S1 family peptidase [Gordonia sp. PP30]UQE73748.1 S1 family peptidase [Gordonia sp. PP30]